MFNKLKLKYKQTNKNQHNPLTFTMATTFTSTERQAQLREALAVYKLPLRNDSSLIKDYTSGSDTHTPQEIAKELALMHWMHNYTSYSTDLTKVKDALVKQHGVFRGIWRSAARTCKLYITSTTEVPEIWPWLQEPPVPPTHAASNASGAEE